MSMSLMSSTIQIICTSQRVDKYELCEKKIVILGWTVI